MPNAYDDEKLRLKLEYMTKEEVSLVVKEIVTKSSELRYSVSEILITDIELHDRIEYRSWFRQAIASLGRYCRKKNIRM